MKLEVKEREGRGSADSRRLRARGPRARRSLRARQEAARVLRARARAAARAVRRLRAARDSRRRPRRPEDDAPGGAQGLPAGRAERSAGAHRPARGSARRADPGAGLRSSWSASRAGVKEGGVLSQVQPRAQGRGAAARDPRSPRARRQRDGDRRHASARRPARSGGRDLPRRSRGDGAGDGDRCRR